MPTSRSCCPSWRSFGGSITFVEVSDKATELFGELFSEKLFRAQLSYFDDVDYTEQVEYLVPRPPTEDEIKSGLTELSIHGV